MEKRLVTGARRLSNDSSTAASTKHGQMLWRSCTPMPRTLSPSESRMFRCVRSSTPVVLLAAIQLGKFKPLSDGEIAARAARYKPYSKQTWRAWQYWAKRAGCGHMVGKPPAG